MLGEQVAEVSGRITSIRVLPQDGPDMHFEVTVQGTGTLLGTPVTILATYHQIVRPDRTLFCPVGHVTLIAANGDSAYWTGFAVGEPTGKPPASRMVPCGHIRTSVAGWQRLNRAAIVTEWVVGEDGAGRWRVWEWKVSWSLTGRSAGLADLIPKDADVHRVPEHCLAPRDVIVPGKP